MFPSSAISAPSIATRAAASWGRPSWTGDSGPRQDLPLVGSVQAFAQDQQIYGQGEAATMFCKIVSGVARTCAFLTDGRRQIDAFYVAGDVFGVEAATEYRVTAEAVSDCTLLCYRRRGFEASALADADLSRQLLAHAMRDVARARDHVLMLGRKSAVEKVAAFLVQWASHSPNASTVTLAMTRQDIADYLGLTIETVSRTLSHLEREGIIAFAGARNIRVTDPAALRALNC